MFEQWGRKGVPMFHHQTIYVNASMSALWYCGADLFAFVRWLPTYLGQLAPTTLPQCQLVSKSRSVVSPPPSLSLSLSLAVLPL